LNVRLFFRDAQRKVITHAATHCTTYYMMYVRESVTCCTNTPLVTLNLFRKQPYGTWIYMGVHIVLHTNTHPCLLQGAIDAFYQLSRIRIYTNMDAHICIITIHKYWHTLTCTPLNKNKGQNGDWRSINAAQLGVDFQESLVTDMCLANKERFKTNPH